MKTASALTFCLVAALAAVARADDAAPAAPTTVTAPAAPTTAAPTPTVDTLAEPHRIIEAEANTPANLKRAIALYEAALADTTLPARVRSDGWADVGRAYMRLGDLESASAAKLALYEQGQAAGKKGEDVDAKNPAAIFWGTANMACVGRTKGVMNSLFMIGDLKKNLNRALALDPNYHFARNTLGEIDHAVPGLAGGSDSRAEASYLEVLRRNPHLTASMVRLAQMKRDNGDDAEARQWAQKVLDEKSPALPHDWRKFDVVDARAVLKSLE
jgi:tetratricopeptide (TPR) repeat protein